jgi:hypothetical protein
MSYIVVKRLREGVAEGWGLRGAILQPRLEIDKNVVKV